MGRNGCGKTTFLTYLAQRKIEGGMPNKMTTTLVRQEIVDKRKAKLRCADRTIIAPPSTTSPDAKKISETVKTKKNRLLDCLRLARTD